jgi:predicted metal-dependent HD superfamily phosphohydrolase
VNEDKIQRCITQLREHALVKSALTQLRNELAPNLLYHSYAHTEDVLSETVRFALIDGVSAREIELLAIAAAYHDIGFIQTRVQNEPIGAEKAREAMVQNGGYSDKEVALVSQMILDTALVEGATGPQRICSTPLSGYLLDADLTTLGRDDFFTKGELLRQELEQGQEAFLRTSLALLTSHSWFTEAARSLRQTRKEENLTSLKRLLEK